MPRENAPSAVQLSDYVGLLRRQWRLLVAGLVLGTVLAGAYLVVADREYTSATSVLVTTATSGASTTNGRAPEINLDTEAQLVRSTETVSTVAEELAVAPEELAELGDRVTVTVPPNTEILIISFVAPTAEGAQDGARAFAEAYLDGRRANAETALDAEYDALQNRVDEVREQLQEVTEAGTQLPPGSAERARTETQAAALTNQLAALGTQQNQVRAAAVSPGRIVTQASLPSSPSDPDVPVTLLAGLLLGLLGGIAAAALRDRADDRIHLAADLERRTNVPVVGDLAGPLRTDDLALAGPSSQEGRTYARLRNVLTIGLERNPRRVVLIAPVHRGGGPVAANVAASLARSGEDVCLVCADVFGHTAAALLGEVPDVGLAEVLAGEQPVDRALRPVAGIPTLRVLGPGRDPDRADALLQTRSARVVFNQLRETVTYVVVESAPTSEGIAAQTLAGAADAAVLVVEAGDSTVRDVVDALGQLEAMQRPVLGAVVVRPEPEQSSAPVVQRPRPSRAREQDEPAARDRVPAGPPPGSTGSALR